MKSWSFYDTKTGNISPKKVVGPSRWVPKIPDGFAAIEGDYDHLSQRVDLETGEVVQWQPPQPDDDHEWNAGARRWVKRPEVFQRDMNRAKAQAQIDHLERRQARRVREILADSDQELKAIDDEIKELRESLAEGKPSGRKTQ